MLIDLGTVSFTPEAIAMAVGVILALVFAYFPGLNLWYAALKSEVKSYIMLGLLLIAEAVIVALTHYGIVTPTEPITLARILSVAFALLISNQPVYTLIPEVTGVKAARLIRDKELLAALTAKK
jgi:hypothetical protein